VSDVRLRLADPDDVEAIRAVSEAAWEAAHEPIVGSEAVTEYLNAHYSPEDLCEQIAREGLHCLVAVDDRIVGYLLADATAHEGGTAGLVRLYVRPERWGEGIGSRLLEGVEARLDADRLRLGVMAPNERAVGFYRDRGFERVDAVYDDELDVTALIMEKAL
jgi:ribosomal protein S18 acetylase RimI-like enzyme